MSRLVTWYLKHARHPFKQKVVGRYWSVLSKRPLWVTYDETLSFRADLRDYVQQKVFYDGYYEKVVVDWLKANLRPGDVFWDVGANVGAMTLLAAKRCERVVALEPEPGARQHLEMHLAKNRLSNVTVLPVALGEREGLQRLYLGPPGNSGMHSLIPADHGYAEVSVLTMDGILERGEAPFPTVMKIDVEGFELSVLRGGVRTLAGAVRAIVFETRDREGRGIDEEITSILRAARFVIEPLGRSDPSIEDDLGNYVAVKMDDGTLR